MEFPTLVSLKTQLDNALGQLTSTTPSPGKVGAGGPWGPLQPGILRFSEGWLECVVVKAA